MQVIPSPIANSNSNRKPRRHKRPNNWNINSQRRGEIIRHAKHVRPGDLSPWLIAWVWHNPHATEWSLMNCAAHQLGWPITRADATELLDMALGQRPRRGADKLGKYLGLSYATRQELQIRTIGSYDLTKRTRKRLRERKNRAAMAAKRLANGAKPHSESLSRTEPWKAEGISRRTWERRRVTQIRGQYSSLILNHESASTEAWLESQKVDFRAGLRPEVRKQEHPSSQTAAMIADHKSVSVRVKVMEIASLAGLERLEVNYG